MKCCKYLSSVRTYLDPSRIDREAIAAQAAAMKTYAGELAARADDLLNYSMEKARGFSILDFAVLKLCVFSFGVWLGAQFSKFFKRFRVFIFLGFVASYIYLIWRLFLRDAED
ncbi:MAG: hypothetical protein ACI4PV_02075 [Butyricicoccus sp.]